MFGVQALQMAFALLAAGQGHVGNVEGGDVVLLGLAGHRFMPGSIPQPHEQLLAGIAISLAGDDGRGGGDDLRICRIGGVGHEDLTPVGRAGARAHVLHIKDGIAKIFIKDARLNLVRGVHGESFVGVEDGLIGARSQIERVGQSQQRAANGHDGCHAHEVADAQAGGAHGDDLAVGRKAAQAQQHPHQNRHGDGDHEKVRQRIENHLHNADEGGTVVDHHLQNARQFLHEKNEGEDHAADQCVGEDLAENVTGQDAHRQALP